MIVLYILVSESGTLLCYAARRNQAEAAKELPRIAPLKLASQTRCFTV